MAKIFKKLTVDGKVLKFLRLDQKESLPVSIEKLLVLKGVHVTDSTPEEFLDYYENKYGSLPDITGGGRE